MKALRTTIAIALASAVASMMAPPAAAVQIGFYQDPYKVFRPMQGVALLNADGTIAQVSKQEAFQLASANVASAAQSVYGGDYILTQTCTAYGTLTMQVLGPDGVTWQTVLTKTASDTTGGTGMSLASYASVRVQLSGTSGCAALLARVPA